MASAMDLSVRSLIGLTVGALLGFVFVLSCIISAAKAIWDRRHIKARNHAKRAGLAHGNGHAPGVKNGSAQGAAGRKPRPNILIVHDSEREERIKRGSGYTASQGSSPRSPSGISSLGEQSSHHTETTTLAEVACHHSSLSSSPGGDLTGGDGGVKGVAAAEGDSEVITNGGCLMPAGQRQEVPGGADAGNRSNSNSKDSAVSFAAEDVVVYRKRSRSGPGPDPDPAREAGSKQTRAASANVAGESARDTSRGDRRQSGAANSRLVKSAAHGRNAASEGNVSHRGKRAAEAESSCVSGSSSFHGFTKNKNAKAPSHYATAATPQRKEYVCASYNPRRNSYAAAIANPSWVELPPVRRHSDEPLNPPTNGSGSSHTYVKNVRMRHSYEGADNPAYEAMDDYGAVKM